jgi:hypothetical protein
VVGKQQIHNLNNQGVKDAEIIIKKYTNMSKPAVITIGNPLRRRLNNISMTKKII